MNIKLISTLAILILAVATPFTAEASAVDFLRSTGKIYAVVAVICVILLGIAFYLYRLDKQISKLEKHINNEKEK